MMYINSLKTTKTMNEHEDYKIVDILARDYPKVFEQILEYLDNL